MFLLSNSSTLLLNIKLITNSTDNTINAILYFFFITKKPHIISVIGISNILLQDTINNSNSKTNIKCLF
jgi:hypothetical protein